MSAAAPVLPQNLPEAHSLIRQLQEQKDNLQAQNDYLRRQLFGSKSDRMPQEEPSSQEQDLMAIYPTPSTPPATEDVVLPAGSPEEKKPSRARQQPDPETIETVTERIEPAEKVCPHCGQEKCEIGCERSERFDYIPAKIIRREILRPKYACRCGEAGVSIAPLPPTPIEKGKPTAALLAHVTLSKYLDHQPLDRQQKIFERLGFYVPRQTLCDWIEKGAELLQPIVRQMKAELLAGDYLQVDETPVRVLDPDIKGKSATGYLWVAGRPGADVIFEFHPGRGKEYALALLGDFAGYLQRDGYGVYGSIARGDPGIIPSGCWAHARRRFVEAVKDEPEHARWFVLEIRKLYQIEAHARAEAFTPEQRHHLRQQLAVPIMAAIKQGLDQWPQVLTNSPMTKAVRYALGEWDALQTYLRDGRLEIDNNLTENAIRPSAVGKKNWLFIGHPEAGWRSAVIYSVIVSCKRRGISPWEYLKDLFERLPGATNQQIAEFTPRAWQQRQAR